MALGPGKRLILEAHEIENGYLLAVAANNGEVAKLFHCETPADIGNKIIALAAKDKLTGGQYELPLGHVSERIAATDPESSIAAAHEEQKRLYEAATQKQPNHPPK